MDRLEFALNKMRKNNQNWDIYKNYNEFLVMD